MAAWTNFAMAQFGAAAALAGLLFVGVSVNLTQVLATPGVVERAGETLIALFAALVVGGLLLLPPLATPWLGAALLALGALATGGVLRLQRRSWFGWARQHVGWFVLRVGLGQLATLPVLLAGVSLLTGHPGGVAWLAVGAFGAYGMAFMSAWVLLVEIER